MSVQSTVRPAGRPARVPTPILVVAGAAFAGAVVLASLGPGPRVAVPPAPRVPAAVTATAAPGEFRLGPGNQTPPGIVNPVARPLPEPAPGEFRLGPGNQTPPGIVNPAH